MNYKHYCRTCLGTDTEMRHIQSQINVAGVNIFLTEILQNFYDYKISTENKLPENICINCVHQLTITYSFKLLIHSTAKKLSENCNNSCLSNGYESSIVSEDDQKVFQKKVPVLIGYQKKINSKGSKRSTDNSTSILYCVKCKSKFHSTKNLIEHCVNNHPVKSNVGRDCNYCNEKFDDFRSLVLHRKQHIKPYLCENCWEGFHTIDDLNLHTCQPNIQRDKNNGPGRILRQCDQCGKSYPPGYIKIHIMTHSNDRAYSCKFCPKKFKVPGSLHSHILWNHKRTRNHRCEVCNATFISSSSRSSHIRKNHLKEKKYSCDSCGKRFFSKSELQRHTLTHTGVKNFHCHLCDKSYQTRYGLNVHLKSHSQLPNVNILNL